MKKNETKNIITLSLKISYFLFSGAVFCFLILLFVVPDLLLQAAPVCEWKIKYGAECFFCGMTRAFLFISGFNFSDAMRSNALSVPLFSVFVINEMLFLLLSRKLFYNIKNNYRIYNASS